MRVATVGLDASSRAVSSSRARCDNGAFERRARRGPRVRATPLRDVDGDDDAVSFAPKVDARATVTSLVIGAAFFIVNRRVAGAVEARRAREALEEERRKISLERLSGSASSDDLDAVDAALESAYEREASAREMFGGAVRVRMPQPLGKPLKEVAEEEKRVDEASGRRAAANAEDEEAATTPPWWMTSVSAIVLVLLTWSAVGLGSVDRVANAPDLTPEELERFRAGG